MRAPKGQPQVVERTIPEHHLVVGRFSARFLDPLPGMRDTGTTHRRSECTAGGTYAKPVACSCCGRNVGSRVNWHVACGVPGGGCQAEP